MDLCGHRQPAILIVAGAALVAAVTGAALVAPLDIAVTGAAVAAGLSRRFGPGYKADTHSDTPSGYPPDPQFLSKCRIPGFRRSG